jgi:hypothetical protein
MPAVKLSVTEPEARNLALRRDNDLLRQQRDILMQGAGIAGNVTIELGPQLLK